VENYYLRPLVSWRNTAILRQIWPLESHKSPPLFVIKYHFMAYYDGMYPLVYLWYSPLPRSAVLFLVVDYDL
jgi:hypothetical protein